MDRKKADEAANNLSLAMEQLEDAGLITFSGATANVLERLEDVLDGGRGLIGDDE